MPDITALGQHIPDEDTRGRLSVDLQDLVETSRWLLATLGGVNDRAYSDEELETLLIDLEVAHLDHASHHIASLRTALASILATFPDGDMSRPAGLPPMSIEGPGDLTDEERVLFGAYGLAADLAAKCRTLREMNVSVSATSLDDVVNTLMTEFWDHGFSETDIRKAFMAAVDDMSRYAAGHERR